MKKIAILYSGAKNWGGVETYLYDLVHNSKDGLEFFVLSIGEWELTDKLKDDAAVEILNGKRINLLLFFKVGKYLKKNNIEVLISQGVVANFYSRIISLLTRVPHLCIVHSELKNEYNNFCSRTFYAFSDWLLRPVTKKFICVSEYLKSVLINKGVDPEKTTVIYNGVSLKDTNHESRTTNRHLVIGSLGRLRHEKGYDILIEAAKSLPDEIEIQIYGEGPEKEKFDELIKKKNVNDKVKLPGFCNDMEQFFPSIDIYIQPSRSEGFGLSVLDAMARGIPVIVSANGALPELAQEGSAIIIKELSAECLRDAILEAKENFEQMKKEALTKRENVLKKFSFDKWLKETEKTILALK